MVLDLKLRGASRAVWCSGLPGAQPGAHSLQGVPATCLVPTCLQHWLMRVRYSVPDAHAPAALAAEGQLRAA